VKDMRPAGRMWHLYKMGGLTPALTSMFDAQSAQQMAFIRSMLKEQRKDSLFEIPLHAMEIVVFDLETTASLHIMVTKLSRSALFLLLVVKCRRKIPSIKW
jgi:hypothetical protein